VVGAQFVLNPLKTKVIQSFLERVRTVDRLNDFFLSRTFRIGSHPSIMEFENEQRIIVTQKSSSDALGKSSGW
jgi:hypothetical protein